MNVIEKFFAFLGGANITVLQKCPTDKNKFSPVGIGVLITAMLSMFTMGFAMHSVSPSTTMLAIIPFAIFWGGVIFSIDWGLIVTMHRPKKFDFWSGLGFAFTTLFRIAVAVLISLRAKTNNNQWQYNIHCDCYYHCNSFYGTLD